MSFSHSIEPRKHQGVPRSNSDTVVSLSFSSTPTPTKNIKENLSVENFNGLSWIDSKSWVDLPPPPKRPLHWTSGLVSGNGSKLKTIQNMGVLVGGRWIGVWIGQIGAAGSEIYIGWVGSGRHKSQHCWLPQPLRPFRPFRPSQESRPSGPSRQSQQRTPKNPKALKEPLKETWKKP